MQFCDCQDVHLVLRVEQEQEHTHTMHIQGNILMLLESTCDA